MIEVLQQNDRIHPAFIQPMYLLVDSGGDIGDHAAYREWYGACSLKVEGVIVGRADSGRAIIACGDVTQTWVEK